MIVSACLSFPSPVLMLCSPRVSTKRLTQFGGCGSRSMRSSLRAGFWYPSPPEHHFPPHPHFKQQHSHPPLDLSSTSRTILSAVHALMCPRAPPCESCTARRQIRADVPDGAHAGLTCEGWGMQVTEWIDGIKLSECEPHEIKEYIKVPPNTLPGALHSDAHSPTRSSDALPDALARRAGADSTHTAESDSYPDTTVMRTLRIAVRVLHQVGQECFLTQLLQ
eukprot:3505055-Rhodomonas_salina.1